MIQIKENPGFFDDDPVYADNETSAETLAEDMLEGIRSVEQKFDDANIGDLLDQQKKLYEDAISEIHARLGELNEELNRELGETLEKQSVEYRLSSLGDKLATIEQKLRRPGWVLVLVTVLSAFLLGLLVAQ